MRPGNLQKIYAKLDAYRDLHRRRNRPKDKSSKLTVWKAPRRDLPRKKPTKHDVRSKSTRPSETTFTSFDGPSEAIKPICKVQLEEEHDRIISNIQALTRRHANDTDNNTTHTLNWKDRRTREASNWDSVRSALQTALVARHAVSLEEVCHHCQSPDVTVRCVDCHYMYLCSTCDQEHHSTDVFHHRQFLIKEEERFLSVPPCTELEETDVKGTFSPIHKEKYLANILKHQSECSTCGDDDLQLNTWGSCIVVTLKGRFDLYLPQWTCKTCHCIKRPSVDDIIRIGYWPGNSKVTPGMYIFEEDVIFTFDLLKKEKSGLSIRAWLSMLEYSSLVKNRVAKISHKVFSEALREWQRLQFCLSNLKGENYMECLACYKGMHANHIQNFSSITAKTAVK